MNNYLQHFGILGMSWGKRNGPPYPLTAAQKSAAEKRENREAWNKAAKKEHDRARSKKSVDQMSDAELRQVLNRLDMEKRYKEITKTDIEKGQDKAKAMLAGAVGGVVITGVTTAAIKLAIKKASKGAINL